MIRPPLVYGPGVRANFLRLIRLVERRLPLPLGAVKNRRSLVYVGNLADLIVAAATSPAAAGQTFLAADGDDLSTPQLVAEIGAGARYRRSADRRAGSASPPRRGAHRHGCASGAASGLARCRCLADCGSASAGGRRSLPRTASPTRCAGTGRWRRLARMRAMQGAAGAVSFVLAFIAVQLLLRRFARFALDRPNERSLHERPVPRTGGLAVLAGTALALGFGAARSSGCRLRSRLRWPRSRSPMTCAASHGASAWRRTWRRPACSSGSWAVRRSSARAGWLRSWSLAWVTNLYNFMDGSDGLAGGMSADRLRRLRASRPGSRTTAAAGRAPVAALRPRRAASWSATSIRRASFWATSAPFRWAFSPARSASSAGATKPGRSGFRCWYLRPFIGDATLTLVKRVDARRARLAGAPRALLPAHGAHGARSSRHRLIGYALMLLCARARSRPRQAPGAAAAFAVVSRAAGGSRRVDRRCDGAAQCMTIRRFLVFVHDLVAAALAWVLAFWLRFNLDIPRRLSQDHGRAAAVGAGSCTRSSSGPRPVPRAVALREPARPAAHPHRGGDGRAGRAGAVRAARASARPCRARCILIAPLLLVVMMGGSRFAYRGVARGPPRLAVAKPQATPVLVLGAGGAAAALIKELAREPAMARHRPARRRSAQAGRRAAAA